MTTTIALIIGLVVVVMGIIALFFWLVPQWKQERRASLQATTATKDTTDLLKKVRRVEIKTKGLSKNLFSGGYHSAFKGRGMSFSEVRNYYYGDDVRNIDWNVTARTRSPHVKVFEEERELTLMLVVDMSKSSFFGTGEQLKSDFLTEVCAVLAFSAMNNNDKVGAIFFTDRIEKFIPPKKGKSHILLIIRQLLGFQPQGTGTDIGQALQYLNHVVKKRSIAFVVSDFITKDYDTPLRIAARKHDIIGLQMIDPSEENIPNLGLIRARDAETGEVKWLDTSSQTMREAYLQQFKDYKEYTRNAFVKAGADLVPMLTNSAYINTLLKFFKRRANR